MCVKNHMLIRLKVRKFLIVNFYSALDRFFLVVALDVAII